MTGPPAGIQPFADFVEGVKRAADPVRLRARKRASADPLAEARRHVLRQYEGATAEHSFADATGAVFDCIPIEQQASVRLTGEAPPPVAPSCPLPEGEAPPPSRFEQFPDGRLDRFGNAMRAPPGTIPVRRLTVERLSSAGLDRITSKGATPPAAAPLPGDPSAPAAGDASHRYASGTHSVANRGCHACLSVWRPALDTAAKGHGFSLGQVWVIGGTGAALQSVEVGYQVYPNLYGHTHPALFIYYTKANHTFGNGGYNLDVPAFVQTNGAWAFGASLEPSASIGGQQRYIEVAFYLTDARWWLYLGGTATTNAVGYYPVSVFAGGAMATQGSRVDIGGETVATEQADGTTHFPPMGSGQHAAGKWQQAAYIRNMRYFPTNGGSTHLAPGFPVAASQGYSRALEDYQAPWNRTLWYGGPGG